MSALTLVCRFRHLILMAACSSLLGLKCISQTTIKDWQQQLQKAQHDTTRFKCYIEIANLWSDENVDSVRFYLDKAEVYSKKYYYSNINEDYLSARAHEFSMRHDKLNNEIYTQQLATLATDLKDSAMLVKAKFNLAVAEFDRGKYTLAIKKYLELEPVIDKMKQNKVTPRVLLYSNLAVNYNNLDDDQKEQEYCEKIIQFAKTPKDSLSYYGIKLLGSHDYEDYKVFFFKGIKLAQSLGDIQEETLLRIYMTDESMRKKKYEEALFFAQEALQCAKKSHDTYNEMLILHNIAISKGHLGQYKEAKQLLKKTFTFFKEDDEELLSQMLREAAEVYSKYGDNKEAYLSLLEATKIEAELKGVEKQKIVAELETQYELNDKQAQIAAKELENKLQQERLNIEQKQKYFFLSLMSLALILAIWAIRNYRIKNKLNKVLSLQKVALEGQKTELEEQTTALKNLNEVKDKLFTIVAHDLKQPALAFQQLGSTLHRLIQKKDIERLEKVGKYAGIMSNNLHLTIENLFRWATIQQKQFFINPKDTDIHFLMNSIYQEFEPLAQAKDIKLSLNVPVFSHAVTDATILTAILRNLLSNAIKFTSAGKSVHIEVSTYDGDLSIQIKDTGMGIPIEMQKDLFSLNPSKRRSGTSQEHGSGLGLMLCKQLSELAKIKLTFSSIEGEGTTFNVTIKEDVSIFDNATNVISSN